jgi:hypothetical protein
MIDSLSYVLVVVFSLGNGQYVTMDTLRSYASDADCIQAATTENATKPRGGTYICKPA